jgi:hypothetical protein
VRDPLTVDYEGYDRGREQGLIRGAQAGGQIGEGSFRRPQCYPWVCIQGPRAEEPEAVQIKIYKRERLGIE